MRLLALSDLHVNHADNRKTLEELPASPEDWLILGGDLGETEAHLRFTLDTLWPKFAKLLWVPGNHELWTPPSEGEAGLRGVARYERLVEVCREYGALTPEDDYIAWPGEGGPAVLCPLFLLYDYSFGPDGMSPEQTIAWAREEGILCVDERVLHPDPYESRSAWCAARVAATAERLSVVPASHKTILINHWPLRRDLVRLFRIPRFIPWCGTRKTEDWHTRFRASVVVSGHLHMRATDWRDGVRFEEVSLGYPRHWRRETAAAGYIRQILPEISRPTDTAHAGPDWHR